jgi:anti-anti-sigma factor
MFANEDWKRLRRPRFLDNREIIPVSQQFGKETMRRVEVVPVAVVIAEGVAIITLLVRRLSKLNYARVKKAVAAAVDFRKAVILDFGSTEYFDSSGLSLIVYWLAEARRLGGSLLICSDSPQIRALIELVRIPSVATVYASRSEAMRDSRQPAAPPDERLITTSVPKVRAAAVGGLG